MALSWSDLDPTQIFDVDVPKPKDILKGKLPKINIDIGGGHGIQITPLGPTIDGVPLGLKPSPELVEHCVQHPGNCIENLPDVAIYETARVVFNTYRAGLIAQVGSWSSLPENFVLAAQPYYNTDLRSVVFATGINTLHGNAITFSNRIFFPRSIDFGNAGDVHWMLHEIQHTEQYAYNGGEERFLGAYIRDSAKKIIRSGRINVHDMLDMEINAEERADEISDAVFEAMWRPSGATLVISNRCDYDLDIAIAHDSPEGMIWEGWYRFFPGEEDSIEGNDGEDVRLTGDYVYFRVVDENGQDWGGDYSLRVDGDRHMMKRQSVAGYSDRFPLQFCSD